MVDAISIGLSGEYSHVKFLGAKRPLQITLSKIRKDSLEYSCLILCSREGIEVLMARHVYNVECIMCNTLFLQVIQSLAI